MQARCHPSVLLERTRAACMVNLEPAVEPFALRLGVDPEPSQVRRGGAGVVQPENGCDYQLLLAVGETGSDAADGPAGPRDVLVAAAVVARTGDAADVRHEIAVALVAAGGCEVVAGV